MKRALLLVAPLALFAACSAETSSSPPAPSSPLSSPMSADVTSSAAPSSAPAVLDQMDTRSPLPLLPMMANHQKQNMRDHLVAVQEIVAALAVDDFPAVERAASRIGFSEQMGSMCTHMGAAAPSFTEQALDFHRTADRIAAAAHDRDRTRALQELGATLQTCTACHAAWKQRVVDEPTWQQLTSSDPPKHGAP